MRRNAPSQHDARLCKCGIQGGMRQVGLPREETAAAYPSASSRRARAAEWRLLCEGSTNPGRRSGLRWHSVRSDADTPTTMASDRNPGRRSGLRRHGVSSDVHRCPSRLRPCGRPRRGARTIPIGRPATAASQEARPRSRDGRADRVLPGPPKMTKAPKHRWRCACLVSRRGQSYPPGVMGGRLPLIHAAATVSPAHSPGEGLSRPSIHPWILSLMEGLPSRA